MRWLWIFVLAAAAAPVATAQFSLYRLDGNVERPVAAVLDLGSVAPAEPATAQFRIRNTSATAAALSFLAVRGTGFSLSGAPAMPAGLAPQQAIEFSVVFRANPAATYSAALDSEGIAVILTATVVPALTFQVDGATLSPAGLNFGTIDADAAVSRRVSVTNLTALPLIVPPISAAGDGFTASATLPSGMLLQPLASASFDVVFQPHGVGTWTGGLTIGDRTYPLTGTSIGVPLPRPILAVDLAEARSSRQGSIAVNLDSAARTAGAGTLTLEFEPLAKGASDAAIQLGGVGRSLPFTIAAGDTQARFGGLAVVTFQTGTTAGTIAVAVELGGITERKTIAIAPEPVGIASAQAVRSASSIELRVNGFDNTRTAGAIVYTFYDASGVPLPAITVDNTADFAAFFAASDAGGAFALRAVFPVTGDASKIAEFQVDMKNSAGNTTTGRIKF